MQVTTHNVDADIIGSTLAETSIPRPMPRITPSGWVSIHDIIERATLRRRGCAHKHWSRIRGLAVGFSVERTCFANTRNATPSIPLREVPAFLVFLAQYGAHQNAEDVAAYRRSSEYALLMSNLPLDERTALLDHWDRLLEDAQTSTLVRPRPRSKKRTLKTRMGITHDDDGSFYVAKKSKPNGDGDDADVAYASLITK